MAPQPQLKSSQLIEEFNRLIKADQLDELTLAKFGREAEKLRSADPVAAAVLAGFLASERGNVAEMEREFQIAIRLAPDLMDVHRNYAICLFQFGYLKQARDEMIRAQRLAPGNAQLLAEVLGFAGASGAFEEAMQLAEKSRLLRVEGTSDNSAELGNMAQFVADHPGVRGEIERLELLLGEVLREFQKTLLRVDFSIVADDESEWLSGCWAIHADSSQIAELNWNLAKKQSRVPFDPEVSLRVNMMFVSAATP